MKMSAVEFVVSGQWVKHLHFTRSFKQRGRGYTKHGPGVHGPPLWTLCMDHPLFCEVEFL